MPMLKKIIKIFANPLLFYLDKDGNAVFRNYCLFKHTGYKYNIDLTKQEVGKLLEYRLEADKKLKAIYIFITILVYFIFIHSNYSLLNILWCEFLWIISISLFRIKASSNYSKFLNTQLGEYELVKFHPNISAEKQKQFLRNFYSKIYLTIIILILLTIPAFILMGGMNIALHSKKPHTKIAYSLSKIYLTFYPQNPKIYDIQALLKYQNNDIKGAIDSYKKVLSQSDKKFDSKDYVRFANLLYLEKQASSPAQALDTFNEYITQKELSVMEQTKMLWIKSIFSIENNITDTVIQDYDDLLLSLNNKDERNNFYINCDKAYMLYLMAEYKEALQLYNTLIPYASSHSDKYSEELKTLYAERGFTRRKIGDFTGANNDFITSGIASDEINSYEPSYLAQQFIVEKF